MTSVTRLSRTFRGQAIACWTILLLALLPAALLAEDQQGEEEQQLRKWAARDAALSLSFNENLLADMGLELQAVQPTASFQPHALASQSPNAAAFKAGAPWSLQFVAPEGHFKNFVAGSLRYQGGFNFAWETGELSLEGFSLRPGQKERTFDVLSADGTVVLYADHMHFEMDRSKSLLRIFNMDLRVSPALAEAMGVPGYAGIAIGTLSMDTQIEVPPPAAQLKGNPCVGNWGPGDVALIDIGSVSQAERSGGRVSITPSARLKNVGTTNVPWHRKFSGSNPPYDNDQHPFLVWALYRLGTDGSFEQLGYSDVKHAFLTINVNCDPGACTNSDILGLGCEDVYSQGTNNSYNNLSFRYEVEAGPGLWSSTCSHFDQDCNGVQDHNSSDGTFDHRLVVDETELQTAGAEYYMEAWYVVRDDVNIYNTMGYQRILPSQPGGSAWSFPVSGGVIEGPALDQWVDPDNLGPGESNVKVDTHEGNVQLAAKVTDLGGGNFRYRYVLQNHDFDREIRSFTVPLGDGTNVSNIDFNDPNNVGANDWSATVTADSITWELPAGIPGVPVPAPTENTLAWGRAFSFTFDADAESEPSDASFAAYDSGSPATYDLGTVTPGGFPGIFQDGFEGGGTDSWTNTTP